MKKTAVLFLVILLAVSILAGCSTDISEKSSDSGEYLEYDATTPASSEISVPLSDNAFGGSNGSTSSNDPASSPPADENSVNHSGLKIIYTSSLRIETLEYDASYDAMMASLRECGGYISYSDQYGGDSSARSAEFQFRIPAENYDRFLSQSNTFGNIIHRNDSTQDITSSYTDVAARIKTLETQETRLLELLEKAEDLDDMLTIETRLSDVRYEIERYTATILQYDNQVSYSTVMISLIEVKVYTPIKTKTYAQELWETITDSLGGFGSFLKGLLNVIIYILPYAVVGILAWLGLRPLLRRAKAKRLARRIEFQAEMERHRAMMPTNQYTQQPANAQRPADPQTVPNQTTPINAENTKADSSSKKK